MRNVWPGAGIFNCRHTHVHVFRWPQSKWVQMTALAIKWKQCSCALCTMHMYGDWTLDKTLRFSVDVKQKNKSQRQTSQYKIRVRCSANVKMFSEQMRRMCVPWIIFFLRKKYTRKIWRVSDMQKWNQLFAIWMHFVFCLLFLAWCLGFSADCAACGWLLKSTCAHEEQKSC